MIFPLNDAIWPEYILPKNQYMAWFFNIPKSLSTKFIACNVND